MANFLKSLSVKGIEIDTSGAVTGDVLKYDGNKFGAASAGGGSSVGALDDLTDVVLTAPEEFQSLVYDGTTWINKHASTVTYVRNAESTTLTTGTVVYLFGATGDHATVKRADMTSDTTSSKTVGVVAADITASNNGPVITRGYIDGIDLSVGYTAGDILWLGDDGAFTKTKATAPDHLVFVGVVVRATNNGIIYVACQNGYELDELHNVSLPSPNSGDFLKYNGSIWVADAIDLGTDTVGNYVATITAGTGVSTTGASTGEGIAHTISIGQSVATNASPAFAGLNIDSGTLYVDATNNRVGVNTTGPTNDFEVNGSMLVDSGTLKVDSTNNRVGVNTSFPLYTLDVNGDLSVDSGALRVDATNNRVGINNISPTVALDVTGAGSITADFTVDSGTLKVDSTNNRVGVNNSFPTVALDVTGAGKISGDFTVDTNTLIVDSTNNRVGINVSIPSTAVDVIGSATVRAASSQDGVIVAGRAGGSSNYTVTLIPATLTSSRTITIPNRTGTLAVGPSLVTRQIVTSTSTSSGFFPANAGIRGLRLYLLGGGGAGGGATTTDAAGVAIGVGGQAGGQAVFEFNESQYNTYFAGKTTTITIGAGGSGSAGGGGGTGGETRVRDFDQVSFNFSVGGGFGGNVGANLSPPRAFKQTTRPSTGLGYSPTPNVGLRIYPSTDVINAISQSTSSWISGAGCEAYPFDLDRAYALENGRPGSSVSTSTNGLPASGYGHGGSGGANGPSQTTNSRSGGNGAPGIVVIDLLA